MSYELCNRVSVNRKKNVIKLSTTSNNVSPKRFTTWEFGKDLSFDEKMYELFCGIIEGNLCFTSVNDSTVDFVYAEKKVKEYLAEQGLNFYRLWDLQGQERESKYKEVYNVFIRAFNEVFSGEYSIKVNGIKVGKLGKYNSNYGCYGKAYYSCSDRDSIKTSYKRAYIIADGFKNAEIIKLDWVV